MSLRYGEAHEAWARLENKVQKKYGQSIESAGQVEPISKPATAEHIDMSRRLFNAAQSSNPITKVTTEINLGGTKGVSINFGSTKGGPSDSTVFANDVTMSDAGDRIS